MDNVHDILPSSDIDMQVTIPSTWAWQNPITMGPIFNIQSGFASIQPALESFMHATIMCTVVFGMMMTTMLAIPYIERKFIGRLMDRLGATTTLRSLWGGESGVTAGEWWKQLPFGMGAPIGWVVNALNSTWGNSHDLETVSYTHLTLPTICSV